MAEVKRVIFMASLYLQMVRADDPSAQDLEDCNKRLGLAKDSAVLKVPAVLRGMLWDGKDDAIRDVDAKLCEGSIGEACQIVSSITPRWLQYGGDDGKMMADIRTVVTRARRATATH